MYLWTKVWVRNMLLYQIGNSVKGNHFHYEIFQNDVWISHFHQCFEMMYAMEGDTWFCLDGEKICLHQGEMCLFMPNQIHSFEVSEKARLWVCVFSEDLVDTFSKETKNKKYIQPVFTPSEILVNFLPQKPNVKFESRFLLQSFLYQLCHEFYQQGFEWIAVKNSDNTAVHQIMSYIAHHYNQNISLSVLAEKYGLNKSYISGLIGQVTRQNFRTYVNGYRLERAKELLKHTEKSVTDICFECGYNNIRTFNRAFAEQMNMSPREFRLCCNEEKEMTHMVEIGD